ncbi:MAG: hypothetical protein DMG24_02595 [Acidobacteria bacterium]|nr:MAG: hypothetical protein DMG24_02595 [Acidobacteriota bacterium]
MVRRVDHVAAFEQKVVIAAGGSLGPDHTRHDKRPGNSGKHGWHRIPPLRRPCAGPTRFCSIPFPLSKSKPGPDF